MKDVYLIAAVGKSGQLGLDGSMPWHDREDLRWFRQMTMGDHVVMGSVTYASTAPLLDGRRCWAWSRNIDPENLLKQISTETDPEQKIWIAGGARTYKAFMPFVRRSVITHIDYDGKADTIMPQVWSAYS